MSPWTSDNDPLTPPAPLIFALAFDSMTRLESSPTTSTPACAIGTATLPVPHPSSSTGPPAASASST